MRDQKLEGQYFLMGPINAAEGYSALQEVEKAPCNVTIFLALSINQPMVKYNSQICISSLLVVFPL